MAVHRSIAARVLGIVLLAPLASACGLVAGDGKSSPFVRYSATQTALALRGEPPAPGPGQPATPTPTAATGAASPSPIGQPPTATESVGPSDGALPTAPTAAALATLPVPTLPLLNNEQRWRAQQEGRSVFEGGPLPYVSRGSTQLWWYDPVSQQPVILGTISGEFLAQAQFKLRGQGVEALEVPYRINVDYGLTALSPAYVERMQRAGYAESVETYIFLTPDISPR